MTNSLNRYCDFLDQLGKLRFDGHPVDAETNILDELDVLWDEMSIEEQRLARKESYRALTRQTIAELEPVYESIDFDQPNVAIIASRGVRITRSKEKHQ